MKDFGSHSNYVQFYISELVAENLIFERIELWLHNSYTITLNLFHQKRGGVTTVHNTNIYLQWLFLVLSSRKFPS
jgi:hypothetical protein